MRYGSLFSGVGGLDLAVEAVSGASCAWHSEVDPDASKVLAHHWPDVPNHGDITAIDWNLVEPVDVLCGGFPCQDISSAGRGAGIKEGTRSGLWYRYADAIRALRPRLVFVENVAALLVRGLDVVLGDLAALGYDAEWGSLRASDVGACHRRERVFLAAWPVADAEGDRRDGRPSDRPRRPDGAWPRTGPQRHRQPAPDAGCGELQRLGGLGELAGPPRAGEGEFGERQRVRDAAGGGREVVADADHQRCEGAEPEPLPYDLRSDQGPVWGPYSDAVARHELLVGRPAPDPTDERGRLNPWFVEWMMCLPHGWVCDHLERRPALKALGNGVVPPQAAAAYPVLLDRAGMDLLERVA